MKEFVERLLTYERELFFLLNGSNSVFLDNLMWVVSSSKVWIPFYLFVVGFLFYKKTFKKEAALTLLFFVLAMVLCDQFSSGLMKPYFERLRPGNHPDFKDLVDVVRGHRGGGFSFISGHATNSFGFAVFLSLVFRNRWVTLVALAWATVISYSRVYLGMHFISDVVGGMIAGTLIAIMMYMLLGYARKKLFTSESLVTKMYPERQGNILAIVFAVYSLCVLVYGQFL